MAIIEAFKFKGVKNIENDSFDIKGAYDKMIKFRQFY